MAWCRGIDPLELLGLYRGVDQGSWDPAKYNFHLYTIVIGAQTLHATGYAMGMQRDGDVGTGDPDRDAAVIAHFGDGASSQGDVNEAFIFAASYNAPVVFFCQNNQWAISEPIERQTRIPLYQRALGFGFPRPRRRQRRAGDVRRHAGRPPARPRRPGPDVRGGLHLPDGRAHHDGRPDAYRLSDDVERWRLKCPIERTKTYLRRNGLADQDFFDQLNGEADDLGARLRAGVQELRGPVAAEHLRPRVRRDDAPSSRSSAKASRRTSTRSKGHT